jgi:hypothetical protein
LSVGNLDLSTILSIIAILVSVVVSGITLLLTQFQGPDISLISSPQFELDYGKMNLSFKELTKQGYLPIWFELKSTSFVFANHGGKSGTILAVDFEFSPTNEFRSFFDRFSSSLSLSTEQAGVSTANIPTTIKAGDNEAFVVSSSIYLVEWKKMALAEVLDPTTNVEDLIERAFQRSRKNFENFCDLISKSKTLGTTRLS